MSSFSIPTTIYNSLDALSRRFWWKPKSSKGRYLALIAWDNLCHPKFKGGLGFRKTKEFNNTLLFKLAWMVASKRDNFCMSILRAKYKVWNDWLRRDPPKGASQAWKAIEGVKKITAKGAYYLIGDGASIDVWLDPCPLGLLDIELHPKTSLTRIEIRCNYTISFINFFYIFNF